MHQREVYFLRSTTVKSPEKIEGIIELLKTFTGNNSTDQNSLKQVGCLHLEDTLRPLHASSSNCF